MEAGPGVCKTFVCFLMSWQDILSPSSNLIIDLVLFCSLDPSLFFNNTLSWAIELTISNADLPNFHSCFLEGTGKCLGRYRISSKDLLFSGHLKPWVRFSGCYITISKVFEPPLVPEFFNTAHRCWHPPGEPWSCWLPLFPRESSLSHLGGDQHKHDPEKNDFPRYSRQSLLYRPPPLNSMALLLSHCYTWQFRWIGVPL